VIPAQPTDPTTDQLRRDGWRPRSGVAYVCGCTPQKLCAGHAERRAVEHYHPETVTR
jgi:hypothetical protein